MKLGNKNKFVKGNIKDNSVKGYFVGRFLDDKGFPLQETDEVEIAWKKLGPEDSYVEGHYHKGGVEINIVIDGSCSMVVNKIKVELVRGEFLIVYPESILSNFEVKESVEMIVVKAPSVFDDKFSV
ncbi:MAG TPA: hypothetical protein VG895_03225 [Patescibacteria group bacterium]|nr:hypothetical protein [Patescibacteria group bacterium]